MSKVELYNADCLEKLKDFQEKSIDVSFTSPPYNRIRNDTYEFYNDNKTNYFDFLIKFTNELLRVTKKYVIINIQCNHFNKNDFYKYIGHYSDKINGIIVWEKTNPQPGNNYNNKENTRSITNAFEYFIFLKDGGKFVSYGKEMTKNVITSSINNEHFKGHGAVMKKEISDWFIKKFTLENDTVLDCFLGCGTTGVSCKEQNRNFIGIEISEKYFSIAKQRIEKTKQFEQLNLF